MFSIFFNKDTCAPEISSNFAAGNCNGMLGYCIVNLVEHSCQLSYLCFDAIASKVFLPSMIFVKYYLVRPFFWIFKSQSMVSKFSNALSSLFHVEILRKTR